MKILILGFSKIKYMPYLNFYLDNIDKKNEIHLLFWNRDLKEEDTSNLIGVIMHEYKRYQEDDVSKFLKLRSFSGYRKTVLRLMKTERFDFIIVLHSLPGVLIADELKKNYQRKYIFDYRDLTYEIFPPFRKTIFDLVKGSYATFVSSDAFRKYLPESEKAKIYTSHNLLPDSLLHREEKEKFGIPSDKIRISFWGFIRHEDINLEIIKKLGADERFELHYYGREQQIALNLKQYAIEQQLSNVFFHGEYKPEDRYLFVRETDLIHNIYYDNNTMLAMGNKYYDGIIFRIPQLCMKGSYMGKRCSAIGIGLECDPYDDNFANYVAEYIYSLDISWFIKNSNREVSRVTKEYKAGGACIKSITIQ